MATHLESYQRRDGEFFLEEERTDHAHRMGCWDGLIETRTEAALKKFKAAPVLPNYSAEEMKDFLETIRQRQRSEAT